MNRVVIPSEDQNGLKALLAEHFGRAPYFTFIDFDETGKISNVDAVKNVSEHVGGIGIAPDQILKLQPNAVIVIDMGSKAINIFKTAGVKVLKSNLVNVMDTITAYQENKLPALVEGCGHTI